MSIKFYKTNKEIKIIKVIIENKQSYKNKNEKH